MSSNLWGAFTGTATAGSFILYFFKAQVERPIYFAGGIVGTSLLLVAVVLFSSYVMTKIPVEPQILPQLQRPEVMVPPATPTPDPGTGGKKEPKLPPLQESSRLMELANSVETMSEADLKNYFGQIFFVGSNANELSSTPRTVLSTLIEDYNVGGLIFYDTSVKPAPYAGVRTANFIHLLNAIKERTKQLGYLPLFLATDFEGGDTAPLAKEGVLTPMPAAMAIGGTRDRSIARTVGSIVGAEMKAVGLNMNFAPVIDVSISSDDSVILDRSFGADQHFVQEMASAFMSGLDGKWGRTTICVEY